MILNSLDDDKAQEVVAIDLAGKTAFADSMVIATGRSQRHVGALADHLLRQLKESDDVSTNGILASAVTATFSQMLGQRMVASAVAGWSRDDYDGPTTVGSKTAEREDDYLMWSLSLSYALQKWFEISGGYNYVQRDSNFSDFNYNANGLFVNLTGKL